MSYAVEYSGVGCFGYRRPCIHWVRLIDRGVRRSRRILGWYRSILIFPNICNCLLGNILLIRFLSTKDNVRPSNNNIIFQSEGYLFYSLEPLAIRFLRSAM